MKMRKFLILIMTLTLMLGMSSPVFASGSITIADPGSHTYTAYKIFDADGTGDSVVYTLDASSPWVDVVMNADGSSKVKGLDFRLSGGEYTVVKQTGFSAADFAALLKAGIPAGAQAISFSGDPLKANVSDDGYYLVVADSGDFVSLATVLGNDVNVQNKNDMPFDKTVDGVKEKGVQAGDTVHFEIKGKVPDDIGDYDEYVYLVKDKMDEGLTFGGSITVKIGGTTVDLVEITNESTQLWGNEVRYNKNDMTFELSLDLVGKTPGAAIEITYDAVVNENATAVVSENNATLQYGDDPQHLTTKDSMTKVYSSKLVIDKYETGAPEQKLPGAKFVLKNGDGQFYFWNETAQKVEWVDAQADATEVVTDSNGSAEFIGLADGTYTLIETEAPKDYAKGPDTEVVIDGSSATSVGLTAAQASLALVQTVNIANTPGSTLPSTGGMGTIILYIAGLLIMLAAAFLLFRRKKDEK